MDEDAILYQEKQSYFKCITFYIVISLVLSSIIFSIISSCLLDNFDADKYKNILVYANIIITTLANISLVVIFIYLLKGVLKKDAIGIKTNLKIFIPLVLTSFAFVYLGEYLCTLFYSLFDMELTSNNQETLEKMINTKLLPLMVINICIIGPFVEEIIFRKCIFGFFKKDVYPLLISAFAFGLLHVISSLDFIHVLPYIVTGFVFGGIYILSKRNIYAVVLAHMIANTVSLVLILAL